MKPFTSFTSSNAKKGQGQRPTLPVKLADGINRASLYESYLCVGYSLWLNGIMNSYQSPNNEQKNNASRLFTFKYTIPETTPEVEHSLAVLEDLSRQDPAERVETFKEAIVTFFGVTTFC